MMIQKTEILQMCRRYKLGLQLFYHQINGHTLLVEITNSHPLRLRETNGYVQQIGLRDCYFVMELGTEGWCAGRY